jgi:CRP-like cAMP-binding protein
MAKLNEQEVSLLSAAKNGLVYLTPNDWNLVIDKADRVQLRKGAILVLKGGRTEGIYLLVKGNARVEIASPPGMRQIGPGEVCGDMSFLEDAPASASVTAESDIEAYQLGHSALHSLFELFPHLGSRFYRSLAVNLSRRLRDMIVTSPSAAPRK